ncbi:MAG: hypothetical protein CMF31_08775 [Kordiimonas sp.]|nr:hypothetical protein [Kordiimonas sp.]|tara:strand:+ start:4767 stop:5375 length:609 start_codon:yes stop_codon:yes gene_type:complete
MNSDTDNPLSLAETADTVEFSRLISIEMLSESGRDFTFEAHNDECLAIAERFDIKELSSFKIKGTIAPFDDEEQRGLQLEITIAACVVQNCIVTGEPVKSELTDKNRILFLPQKQYNRLCEGQSEESEFSTEELDFELLPVGKIDIGELATQYLGLAVPQYPRKENVEARQYSKAVLDEREIAKEREKNNPFAILTELKHNS